jgi:2-keto-4-pentenoate hydratase
LTPDLDQLARRQLADYDAANPGSAFDEPELNLTVPEAYDLQFRVASLRQLRGETIAGYKVGCVSLAVQSQLALDQPLFGHVFATELYRSGVSLDASRFHKLAVEGEFAFRLAEDIPDAEWLVNNPERAIGRAFAVIELHNYVCRAPVGQRAQELIANNGMHAGVVLPEQELDVVRAWELQDETISVKRNGTVLGTATGRDLPGGPLASMVWLSGRLREFGKVLHRGQIVLAGSPLPLYDAKPADRIEVQSSRLPEVTLTISPDTSATPSTLPSRGA